MQTESRLLANGIDTDNALPLIEGGSLLNAVNTRIQRQRGQRGGSVSFLRGNLEASAVTALLPTGTNTLIGKCVDDDSGCLYLFIHSARLVPGHCIIEYDAVANTARLVIEEADVTGGLGFTADMFIDCEVGEGPDGKLLFWADGGELKYVNLSTTYTSVPQSQLTVITEPGMVPATATRVNTTGVTSSIQTTAVQFTYRVVNSDGFTSVLAPYSLVSLPARDSEILADADSGNSVTVTIPYDFTVPGNWKRVELVARIITETGSGFYTIKRWDRSVSADVTSVNNHNAGTTHLGITAWTGATLELLDTVYISKLFDSIPQQVARLRLAGNRLLIANFTEGYDTPSLDPGVIFSMSPYSPAIPSGTSYTPYFIIVKEKDVDRWWFAIILRIGGANYLLPRETSTGKISVPFLTTFMNLDAPIVQIPTNISSESLILLNEAGDPNVGSLGNTAIPSEQEARHGIVSEANELGGFEADTTFDLFTYDQVGGPLTVFVEDTPAEFGPGSESRAFVPGAVYQKGIQYYDAAGRKSGVQPLGTFVVPIYDASAPVFTELINVTVPGGVVPGVIPDEAEYFSITLSRAWSAIRFGFFFGGIVKALFKDANGNIVYRDRQQLITPTDGYTLYGIGVPIPQGLKYDFTDGDQMAYSVDTFLGPINGVSKVIGVYKGHFVIQFSDITRMPALVDGLIYTVSLSAPLLDVSAAEAHQPKTIFTLYSGAVSSQSMYEVAAFGNITTVGGDKQFGNFFATGTQSIDIYGDAHTVKRTSAAGGGLGLSMSPRDEAGSLLWVNDLGRVADTDSVGQKTLENAYRWSNARIPGSSYNGYASFDAGDIDTTDITAGAINYMVLTTRGAQDGGQLLFLCEHGSFAVLVGQQVINGADGKTALSTTAQVVSKPNPLRGGWGCQSPRSVVAHEGKVWWVDAYKRNVIEFNESGAGNISNYFAARLFNSLLALVSSPEQITCGVDPFHSELLVSLPSTSYSKSDLVTVTGLPDPLDAATGDKVTYRYNYEMNRWVGSYTSGAGFSHVGDKVLGWLSGKLWREFVGTIGTYYGNVKNAMVVIPFNAGQNAVYKAPLSLHLQTQRKPDSTWIVAREASDEVAGAQAYRAREGSAMAAIMRNRVGFGAATSTAWQANGVRGNRLKGAVIVAVLIWNGSTTTDIVLSTATLGFDVASGH